MTHYVPSARFRNRFGLTEWSGAVGDLGTLLPLAFALVVYNDFPITRLFLLWGVVYIVTGYIFKVPISVQPLKAMAVIAITSGVSMELISTASVLYGVLFLLLTISGLIRWLHRLFTQDLVRGVQLGIGLMLGKKAIDLVWNHGIYLGNPVGDSVVSFWMTLGAILLLYGGMIKWNKPVVIFLIGAGLIISWLAGVTPGLDAHQTERISWTVPKWSLFLDAIIILILPQLPLTLGNAVYAADDAVGEFWLERKQKVTAPRLAGSIGIHNIFIGLFGGFPICHGAGGIAAHARFGARTGGATMLLGSSLIFLSLVDGMSAFIFLIPIPILGALLLFDSWSLVRLVGRLHQFDYWIVALGVGVTSFLTNNLTFALVVGLILKAGMRLKFIGEKIDDLTPKFTKKLKLKEET